MRPEESRELFQTQQDSDGEERERKREREGGGEGEREKERKKEMLSETRGRDHGRIYRIYRIHRKDTPSSQDLALDNNQSMGLDWIGLDYGMQSKTRASSASPVYYYGRSQRQPYAFYLLRPERACQSKPARVMDRGLSRI